MTAADAPASKDLWSTADNNMNPMLRFNTSEQPVTIYVDRLATPPADCRSLKLTTELLHRFERPADTATSAFPA